MTLRISFFGYRPVGNTWLSSSPLSPREATVPSTYHLILEYTTFATMASPNLQEIHDFLFELALKAGDMITSAKPGVVDTKKNCTSPLPEENL